MTTLGEPTIVALLAVLVAVVERSAPRTAGSPPFLFAVIAGNLIFTTPVKHLADRVRPAFNPTPRPSARRSRAAIRRTIASFAATALLMAAPRPARCGRGSQARPPRR